MKRKIFAIIIAVAITALLMNVTWIVYEEEFLKEKKDDNDQKEKTVPTPEEVNLTLNISSRGLTNYSNDFWIEGAPGGSNYTWTLNGVLLGYGKDIRYYFFEVGIFSLEVIVKWNIYSKSISEDLTIQRMDQHGGTSFSYPYLWDIELEDYPTYILMIEPGITDPELNLNITLSVQRSSLKYWIKLEEDDKMEPFEVVHYEYIPVGGVADAKSIRFEPKFFKEHEKYEPYHFKMFVELGDTERGSFHYDISYDLTY